MVEPDLSGETQIFIQARSLKLETRAFIGDDLIQVSHS